MYFSEMTKSDFEQFWPVFKRIIQAQETYAFDPDMDVEAAYQIWCVTPHKTYIVKTHAESQDILGSFYIKPNAAGPSKHIANCGYMVNPNSRGQGIARLMCEFSQQRAIELGYTAMQFNSVVSSNTVAVKLWEKLGYKIIGTIPDAFCHPSLGYVDAYIMYKSLAK